MTSARARPESRQRLAGTFWVRSQRQSWQKGMGKFCEGLRLRRFFATASANWQITERLGVLHLVNLARCSAR